MRYTASIGDKERRLQEFFDDLKVLKLSLYPQEMSG